MHSSSVCVCVAGVGGGQGGGCIKKSFEPTGYEPRESFYCIHKMKVLTDWSALIHRLGSGCVCM